MTGRPPTDSERLANLERQARLQNEVLAGLAVQAFGISAVASGQGVDPRRLRQRGMQAALSLLSDFDLAASVPPLETRDAA
jgi:hypothetical protein